jgi:tryptophan 2,3-dioxygenase
LKKIIECEDAWLQFISNHIDIVRKHMPNAVGTGKTEGKSYLEKVRQK